jgi:hypothetical protein
MKCTSVLLLAGLIAVMLLPGAAPASELRFGPWAYYAPYYFPPPDALQCLLGPDAFNPKYESPAPPAPSSDPGPPPCPENDGRLKKRKHR